MKRLLIAIFAPAIALLLLIWVMSFLFLSRNAIAPLNPLIYPNAINQSQKAYPLKTWLVIQTSDSVESIVTYYRQRLESYHWEYIYSDEYTNDFDQTEQIRLVLFCFNKHQRNEEIGDRAEACGRDFDADYIHNYYYNEQIQIRPKANGITEIRIP